MCPRFLNTEFRRIYGIVFRILLCGEAKLHLHIFLASISLRNSFCELAAFIVDCNFNYRYYNQQKCDKCHLINYCELSDISNHNPCYLR